MQYLVLQCIPITSDVPESYLPSQSHLKFVSCHVRAESQEPSSHFESLVCKLKTLSSQLKLNIFLTPFFATKWRPTSYKMASKELKNGAQCLFS